MNHNTENEGQQPFPTSFSGKSNSNLDRFKGTTKKHPCPICDNVTGYCKYKPLDSLILCHNFNSDVNGFKFVGMTRNTQWGMFVPESDFKGITNPEIARKREEQKQERERLKREQQAISLSDSDRHREHTKLVDQLTLNESDKADLKRRGLTDEQIRKGQFVSIKQFQKFKEYVSPRLAGVGVNGQILTNRYNGYICPVRNLKGEIVAYQIRVSDKQSDAKYVWAVSKENTNRNVEAKSHLKESGELPLNCAFLNPESKELRLCEGILKPYISACLRNQNYIGASGGNFTASLLTLKLYLEEFKPEKIIICPDAGTLYNKQVLNNWRKVRDLLKTWGLELFVETWDKADELDVDEIEPDTKTKIISYLEWDTDYRQLTNIETEFSKAFISWTETKNFIPTQIINQLFLTIPFLELPWKDGDTYFIKSGLGTGKTTWLIGALKREQRRIFALGKINSLLLQFCAKSGDFYHYQEHEGHLLIEDKKTNFLLCINSLIHFKSEHFDGAIIIIDEVVSVVKQLYSSFLGKRRNAVIRMFEEAIKRAAIVVCLDGTLTDDVANYINKLRNKADGVYKILNTHKTQPLDIRIISTTDSGDGRILTNDTSGLFKKILTHKQPVFVTATSRKNCETLDRMATKLGLKVIRLDSTTSTEDWAKQFLANPDEYIERERPDLVIISPSGGEGLDIAIKGYFEVAYHIGNCLDADTNYQMIARLRDVTVPRYLYLSEQGFILHNDDDKQTTYGGALADIAFNLLDDSDSLDSDEYAKKYHDAVMDYVKSPHLGMIARFEYQSDFEQKHLRECVILLLQKAGHKVTMAVIESDKQVKEEIKQTKEEMTEEKIHNIFNAEDIPDTLGKRWSYNSNGLTKEQRFQFQKWSYKQALPGIENTEHWNLSLIEMLVKKPKLLSALTLGYLLKNPDKAKQLTANKIKKVLDSDNPLFLGIEPSFYQKVKFLIKIGFLDLLNNSDGYINPEDMGIMFIHGYCKKEGKRLGFEASGNDRVKTFHKLLKAVGLDWKSENYRDGGEVKRRYKLLPLSELEQALTDAIAQRINDRLGLGDSSTDAEANYKDWSKYRDDEPLEESPDSPLESPLESPQAVADVGDHIYIDKQKTSATATLPSVGAFVSLQLPENCYFEDALRFSLADGKDWTVTEYRELPNGSPVAFLQSPNGESTNVPSHWLKYACVTVM